jgi:hypothetical protein
MEPIKNGFEFTATPRNWALGIGLDLDFRAVWLGLGPFGIIYRWGYN